MGHWESAELPEDFDGVVRLFPLPNLVLFPHVIQALHIFEPRYCDMLSESLESDHLITMALLVPGWESMLKGKPAIGDVVCIGKVISHTPTDDGRHNILLAGIRRARILEEIELGTSFRQAKVEVLQDYYPEGCVDLLDDYRKRLLGVFRSMIPEEAVHSKTFADLLTQQLPLGILTDIVAYAVSLPPIVKQELLGEANVVARYELLIKHLGPMESTDSTLNPPKDPESHGRDGEFPPRFSVN